MAKMYHSASVENRTSILKHGLLAERDTTGYEAVFFADCPYGAVRLRQRISDYFFYRYLSTQY